jgi:SAM-dependent methyltransferase
MTTIPGRPEAGARRTAEQAAMWDGPAGEHRLTHADQDDNEVSRHDERMRAAARVGLTDHVLDIGCGTGQSTRDAARAATAGSVLGVDLSARMLERARALTEEQGLSNVSYRCADAQSHRWAPGRFDLLISRFGAMFFTDPVAAFTNLGRALRPGARLILLVWQDYDRNEWAVTIRRSIAGPAALAPSAGAAQPFSLGEPATVRDILGAAGLAGVSLAGVHEPVYYGQDAAAAYDFVRGLRMTREAIAEIDPAEQARALGRLRAAIDAHKTSQGVLFDSRGWLVTAHRP